MQCHGFYLSVLFLLRWACSAAPQAVGVASGATSSDVLNAEPHDQQGPRLDDQWSPEFEYMYNLTTYYFRYFCNGWSWSWGGVYSKEYGILFYPSSFLFFLLSLAPLRLPCLAIGPIESLVLLVPNLLPLLPPPLLSHRHTTLHVACIMQRQGYRLLRHWICLEL